MKISSANLTTNKRNVTTLTTPTLNTSCDVTTTSPTTPVAETTNVTSGSTLILNTANSTAITSAAASTPTAETKNVTSHFTIFPNTAGSSTITSASASTPTAGTTNVTSLSTLIPNTANSKAITSTPASTQTVERTNFTSPGTNGSTTVTSSPASTPKEQTPNVTSHFTIFPNTAGSSTITSVSASTPTDGTTNVTSLSTLIPNTANSKAITSTPASTQTVERTNFTSPGTNGSTTVTSSPASTPKEQTPNVTSHFTIFPNTADSSTITSASASTPTAGTTNVTSLSTLIPNTANSKAITSTPASTQTVERTNFTSPGTNGSTTVTSSPASTPKEQTPNVTSHFTIFPNTAGSSTITSASASTSTAGTTNVTSLSTLIPNTANSKAITSTPASTQTVERTNVTSQGTNGSTTVTSSPASTPKEQTPNVTSHFTIFPNTADSSTITSASASTSTAGTTNVTSLSTLIPNTANSKAITSTPASTQTVERTNVTSQGTNGSTTVTSSPASTPKEQTPNVTSHFTIFPNTADSSTITSASASTSTAGTTNVTSLSTLIPNTANSKAITSTPASTQTVERTNVTSQGTNGSTTVTSSPASTPKEQTPTDSSTITSASASTPTAGTTNVTSLSTLIPNTANSKAITSTPASTQTVERTNFTSPGTNGSTTVTSSPASTPKEQTPNVTGRSTLIPNTANSTKITSAPASTPAVETTSQSTTTKPPTTTVLTTSASTAPLLTPTEPTKPTTAPILPPSEPSTTTLKQVNRKISLSIDETFDSSLNNQNSDKFKKYKSEIESAIDKSYKGVTGFISATVTGFRPGSVIVDFFITSSEVIQISEGVKQNIYTNMKEFKFNVNPTSVAETENINLRSRDPVFPEQDITLSCPATNHLGNIDWRFQGDNITKSSRYVFSLDHLSLTVKSVTSKDNGRYECLYSTSTGPHITWDRVDYIKPYPSMQVPTNKTYKCEDKQVDLVCCVHIDYSIQWVQDKKMLSSKIDSLKCSTQFFTISSGNSCGTKTIFTCNLDNKDLLGFSYSKRAVELVVSEPLTPNSPVTCFDEMFGFGKFGDPPKLGDCEKNKVGFREGVCQSNGFWKTVKDMCVLRVIFVLKQESQVLDTETLTNFVIKVNNVTAANSRDIVKSQVTVSAIVEILNNIADISQESMVDEVVVTNFLNVVDIISSETAKPVWAELNSNGTSQGNSSQLLKAIENVIKATSDRNFNITSPSNSFLFKKVTTSVDFRDVLRLNSTAEIFVPYITSTHKNVTITAVAFSSLGNVMPARNHTDNLNKTENVINGLIVVVNTSKPINNIELSFEKLSNSVDRNKKSVNLGNPQCVFWEFNLFNSTGGWDSTGCEVMRINGTVTCHCNHTTSFSLLMSPYAPEDLALSAITYVGVAISIASLVVCLIIETITWKAASRNSTSHVRHVSLVNIALSLLIADICFIIAASIAKPGENYVNSCSAAVFFTHFFYLALFFWMLFSALLLLYRTTAVFYQISKSVMMAVAFIVGYGAPLLISVITVASTAGSNKYVTQNGTCWLNWDLSMALLAFVLPALVIVVVNIIIVIIVIIKLLRRGVGESNRDEKNVLVVILRCVAILTPLFGITWGLGLGIMIQPKALAIHYLFAIFNSVQGFLILVFGTLMEKKVRETLKARLKIRRTGSRATHSSSSEGYTYSSSNRTTLTDVFNTLFRRGRIAGANISHNTRASEGFLNT
ncbi:uncharacterized protein [Pseudorasbora parva]|uniref:uncharacterized protein isoform X3 n=1 Tax=Pseudorasbora parva TaxID=51549 RepID=UPI00351EDE5D